MELKHIGAIKDNIKEKIERGDYITLSKILCIPTPTANARYVRNCPKSVAIMKDIVKNRERLIESLQKKYGEI